MHTEPKSRQLKLVDALFAYFGDMTTEVAEDSHTLRIGRHLLTLGDELMSNHFILPFIDVWNAEHPEEEELTRRELRWALDIYDTNMTQLTQERHQSRLDTDSTRAKLRVINGGLSNQPDRPYVPPQDIVHEYDF